jgi:hypothetical protein
MNYRNRCVIPEIALEDEELGLLSFISSRLCAINCIVVWSLGFGVGCDRQGGTPPACGRGISARLPRRWSLRQSFRLPPPYRPSAGSGLMGSILRPSPLSPRPAEGSPRLRPLQDRRARIQLAPIARQRPYRGKCISNCLVWPTIMQPITFIHI